MLHLLLYILTENIKQNQFCFHAGNIPFCVLADGSLPKEPKGDVSSQIAGKAHKHKHTTHNTMTQNVAAVFRLCHVCFVSVFGHGGGKVCFLL